MPPALLENSRAIVPSSTALTGVFRGARISSASCFRPPRASEKDRTRSSGSTPSTGTSRSRPSRASAGGGPMTGSGDGAGRATSAVPVVATSGRPLAASITPVPGIVHAVAPSARPPTGAAIRCVPARRRACRSHCRTARRSPRPRTRRRESRIRRRPRTSGWCAAPPSLLRVLTAATPRRRLACLV